MAERTLEERAEALGWTSYVDTTRNSRMAGSRLWKHDALPGHGFFDWIMEAKILPLQEAAFELGKADANPKN